MKFESPTVSITEGILSGQFSTVASIYFSKSALAFLGAPKEVCLLFDSRGPYLAMPDIDSNMVLSIRSQKIGTSMNDLLRPFIGTNSLEKIGDKYYLEKLEQE